MEFYNPYVQTGLGTTYYGGTYTLAYADETVAHEDGQPLTEFISGKISTSYGPANWEFQAYATFPAMDSATNIDSFNGTKLKGNLNVTFTAKTGYTYKLKISLNGNVPTADTYNNYVSGRNVKLSASNVAYIQRVTSSKTITLRATLLSYKSGALIGEKTATCNVQDVAGLHLRISGAWKDAIPYVRVNGAWKECVPNVRINNQWKEGI